MSERFTLRFVLAEGRPTLGDLEPLWAGGPAVRRTDDGVLELLDGDRLLARVDLLPADDARGRAILSALVRSAGAHGEGEALESVLFVLEGASGVILASPVATSESELESAMEPLDALWEYLFEAHGGVLQVDGEGIHGEEGPLVAIS